MTQSIPVRIGTRGSPLALRQAEMVRDLLIRVHGAGVSCEIVPLKTTGDRVLDRPLADAGGKGLFTKEIDEAQLSGRVDLGVHSAKDVPTFLPKGISIAAYLPREDARDVLVTAAHAMSLADLPKGAAVGTSSVRRQALVLRARPDVSVKLLRGNVGTRIEKVIRGEFDAAVLALAGMRRLGLSADFTVLDPAVFPPSVGQGAIAITIRTDDERTAQLAAAVNDRSTFIAVSAERAFLAALDGSCRAPIGGHARVAGERLHFSGIVISPDGTGAVETSREGNTADAEALGRDAGEELRARAPARVLDA